MSSISPVVSVTITLRVDNVREFVRAARAQARLEGYTKTGAIRNFNYKELGACAQMLLDPGAMLHATVIESTSQEES
jgi:hypothetical protein